jgi:hypothetical protein
LLNTSFLACAVFFNFMYLLFTVLFHFEIYWSPVWVHFIVSMSSQVFYFCCLDILWVDFVCSF